jgi:WD40 repeat protein
MYQSIIIEYSKSENLIAMGMQDGVVQLSELNRENGWPEKSLFQLVNHLKEITFLKFIDNDQKLLSFDKTGLLTIWDVQTGEVIKEKTIDKGLKRAVAALSPDESTLFVYNNGSYKTVCHFAYNIADDKLRYGLVEKTIYSDAIPYPLDNNQCLFHYLCDDDLDLPEQRLATFDFNSGKWTNTVLPGGPKSTFNSESEVIDINVAKGIGIRKAYNKPYTINGDLLRLNMQLFNLHNNETTEIAVASMNKDNIDNIDDLFLNDIGSEEFRDATDSFLSDITSAKLTDDGKTLWIGINGGSIRCVDIETGNFSPFIKHGNLEKRKGFTLDDVVSRNATNNITLGISPSGKYISYCNPNEFFCTDNIDIESKTPIQLPKHFVEFDDVKGLSSVETNYICPLAGGKYLVTVTHGGQLRLTNLENGKAEIDENIEYGSDVSSVAMSPDEQELIVTYYGRDSLLLQRDDGMALPFGPSVRYSNYLNDGRKVFVHAYGAVMVLNENNQDGMAFRKEGDKTLAFNFNEDVDEDIEDEYDEDEDENDGFDEEGNPIISDWYDFLEQHNAVDSVQLFYISNIPHVLMVDEMRDVDIYKIGKDTIEHVETVKSAGSFACGSEKLMVGSNFRNNLVNINVYPRIDGVYALSNSFVAEEYTTCAMHEDQLLIFNAQNELVQLNPLTGDETVLLKYQGRKQKYVSLFPESNLAMLVDIVNEIHLFKYTNTSDYIRISLSENKDDTLQVHIDKKTDFPGNIDKIQRKHKMKTLEQMKREHIEKDSVSALFNHEEREKANKSSELLNYIKELLADNQTEKVLEICNLQLESYAGQSFFTVEGSSDFKENIGRLFHQRSTIHMNSGNFNEAGNDAYMAVQFRFFFAYNNLFAAFYNTGNYANINNTLNQMFVDFDTKKGIGISSSIGLYRLAVLSEIMQAQEQGIARKLIYYTVKTVVDFQKNEKQSEDVMLFDSHLKALAEWDYEGPQPAIAKELYSYFKELLACYPDNESKYDKEKAKQYDELQIQCDFQCKNQNYAAALELANTFCSQIEHIEFSELLNINRYERYRIGSIFIERGHAFRGLGQYDNAAQAYRKAIYFDCVDASEHLCNVLFFDLKDYSACVEAVSDFMINPYSWSNGMQSRVNAFHHAWCFTLYSASLMQMGHNQDVSYLNESYPNEMPQVKEKLETMDSKYNELKNIIGEILEALEVV